MGALEAGFRGFDTAPVYRNEDRLGSALKRWELQSRDGSVREHLFVTTKCSPRDMSFAKAQQACRASLDRLGRDALDLYLLHWPAIPKKPHGSAEHRPARHAAWRALEKLYREGLAHSIGVSNFTAKHLAHLLEDGVEVMPMVNQIEVHPFFVPEETIAFCSAHGIQVQAYAPLGGGPESNVAKVGGENGTQLLLEHSTVVQIAKECGRSPAQVLLRWSLQRGFAAVLRTGSPQHMAENFDSLLFQLSEDQMDRLSALRYESPERKFCWDPKNVL